MLTGGGDCPGLNPVIRAVCRRLWEDGHETVGVLNGWRGMIDGNLKPLGWDEISGILHKGGTIIGTSRTNPYKNEGGVDGVKKTFEQIDALVAIGGEDTLGVAARLYAEDGLPVVGVPKTIDNDLNGTDYTFGFDTAVTSRPTRSTAATRPPSRTTGSSSSRRWAATPAGSRCSAGIAGGADYILIPEQPVVYDDVAAAVERRSARGKNFSVIVVSEGCELPGVSDEGEVDEFGHVRVENRAIGDTVAQEIEARTGMQARATVLGYIQRGGIADPARPHPRPALRPQGGRPRRRRQLGPDGGAARRRRRLRAAHRGDRRAEARAGGLVRDREDVLRLAPGKLRSNAGVAQLVEHQLPKLRVVGSNPIARFMTSPVKRALCTARSVIAS